MGKRIFDSIEMGGLRLKNRLVKSVTQQRVAVPDVPLRAASRWKEGR